MESGNAFHQPAQQYTSEEEALLRSVYGLKSSIVRHSMQFSTLRDYTQLAPGMDKKAKEEYNLRSNILYRLNTAATSQKEERVEKALMDVQAGIATLEDRLAALRFTARFVEICRERGYGFRFEKDDKGRRPNREWEMKESTIAKILELPRPARLEYFRYALIQAYGFRFDPRNIEEALLESMDEITFQDLEVIRALEDLGSMAVDYGRFKFRRQIYALLGREVL